MRSWLALLVIAVAGCSVAAWAADEGEGAPKRGGILEFGIDAPPPTYDCHEGASFIVLDPLAPHYSTLLKFDAANYPQVKGDLAASWTVSPDQRTYTFKLRPNVLFHDGTPLTSDDVKASYERIINPPPGVLSFRKVTYSTIREIDTPDPLTIVFHTGWADPVMLANFASPWNCIYSAAKLREDPLYPRTHVLGTGPFVFAEYVKGDHWTGNRWDKYFMPGEPYLDGFRIDFTTGEPMMQQMLAGKVMGYFASLSLADRDRLIAALGDKITAHEGPWIFEVRVVFNTKHPPLDDVRVRRALEMATNRDEVVEDIASAGSTPIGLPPAIIGGVLRPGFAMATSRAELEKLPGYGQDPAAGRAEAMRLLKEAGVDHLKLRFVNSDRARPYQLLAHAAITEWEKIGVTVDLVVVPDKERIEAIKSGDFDVVVDFSSDHVDDPTLQLARYISPRFSPANFSGASDELLDALYVGQAITPDIRERARIVREFERRAIDQAYSFPLLWLDRIVMLSSRVKGWSLTPSHLIGMDFADIWLDQPGLAQ
jgi:peptide/nickel transport system substrate-binding protein